MSDQFQFDLANKVYAYYDYEVMKCLVLREMYDLLCHELNQRALLIALLLSHSITASLSS